MRRRRDAERVLLALAVPLVAVHAGVLLGGVYFQKDVQLMWLGGTQAIAEALLEGSWPFWNVRSGFGEPLLANANHQVLYPLAWPGLLLPPGVAYTLLVVVHHLLLGAGAVALARETGQSRRASVLVGVWTMAVGPVVSLAILWNQLCGFAWLPWAAVAMMRAARTGSRRALAAVAACLASSMLAGSPEAFVAAALATFGIACAAVQARSTARPLAGWLAAVLLGAALCAPQWLPTLHAARASSRSRVSPEARLASSVHPSLLPDLVVRVDVAAQALDPARRVELFGAWDPLIATSYLGGGVFVLAALAVSRRRLAIALLAGVLLAVGVALGRNGPLGALVHLPVLGMLRYPSKALILVGLGVPLLAGLGWDRASAMTRREVLARVLATAAVIGVAVATPLATLDVPVLHLAARSGPALLVTAVVMAALLHGGRRAHLAAGVLAACDLLLAHAGLHATAPATLFKARPALVEHLRHPEGARLYAWDYFVYGAAPRHLGSARGYELVRAPAGWHGHAAQAHGLRLALYPPTAAAWGISGSFDTDVAGLGSEAVSELRDLLIAVDGRPEHTQLLRAAAVTHVAALHEPPGLVPVATDPGLFRQAVRLFAVPAPVPRARVVDGVVVTADPATVVGPHADAAHPVRLAAGVPRVSDPAFTSAALVRRRTADRILAETEGSGASHLVLADAWDRGWTARLDGALVPVLKADHAFMAVALPPGRHRVELRYTPPGLGAGLAAAALALAGLAALCRPELSGGTAPRA